MELSTYQFLAYDAIQSHHNDNKEEVMHWAVGLGEEAGEALSVIKHRYYGNQYDPVNLVGELGDVLWYISALCTATGISLDDVAQYNLEKLHHRYPNQAFDEKRSQSRHELDKQFEESTHIQSLLKKIREGAK